MFSWIGRESVATMRRRPSSGLRWSQLATGTSSPRAAAPPLVKRFASMESSRQSATFQARAQRRPASVRRWREIDVIAPDALRYHMPYGLRSPQPPG